MRRAQPIAENIDKKFNSPVRNSAYLIDRCVTNYKVWAYGADKCTVLGRYAVSINRLSVETLLIWSIIFDSPKTQYRLTVL